MLPPESDKWGDAASIGYPLPGFSLLVVDEHLQLVPAGVAGELLIASDFLSPGYHNKSEESARRFISAEGFAAQSCHAYRTGDLVRLEHDDRFSYLGRIDNQLKIRGFRIEPSEVEAAINALEGVQVSAVVGRADHSGSQQLIAFIAGLLDDKGNQKDKIKRGLRLVLPEYMVPTELVFVDKLPTTPSGKIDRKALLKVDIIVESSTQMPERSLTKTQEQVRALWETLFPGRHIALHDDFSPLVGILCWPHSWFFCCVRRSIAIFLYVCYLITQPCRLWLSPSTAILPVKRGASMPLIVPLFRMDMNVYIGRGVCSTLG